MLTYQPITEYESSVKFFSREKFVIIKKFHCEKKTKRGRGKRENQRMTLSVPETYKRGAEKGKSY